LPAVIHALGRTRVHEKCLTLPLFSGEYHFL
jgi:hypothetical protein